MAGEVEIATAAIGGIQAGLGMIEKAAARRRQKKLFARRSTYQTPDELIKLGKAVTSESQTGFDPATLAYITGKSDQAFGAAIGSAERLGGDPNSLSGIFHQQVDNIMKTAGENAAIKMEKFSKLYLPTQQLLADSATAEWQSKENLLKDQLAAEGVNFQNANANTNSGLNAIIGAGSAYTQSQLFKDKQKLANGALTSQLPTTPGSLLLDNNLPMGQ